jgi:type I restriction enzyme S subunit
MDTIEKISVEAVSKTNLKLLPKGTFLIAITGMEAEGTRGSCGIVGAEATTNQHCMALFPTKQLATHYLFHYYVFNGKSLALQYCQGTKQQDYTGKIVKLLPILLPPLPEQRAIAATLSDVDALMASLDRLIAKKHDIKQATMQQLLTGKTRLPWFSGKLKSGYKETEVGMIPEDWEVLSLGELAKTVASGRSKAKSTHGTYPVHGSTGVIGYAESAEYEGNALLVARVGANAGKLTFVTGRYGVTDNTIIVRLKPGSWLPFFWQQLETKRLNTLVFGSGQPLITGTQLKGLLLCVPPVHEQKAIAAVLSDMDAEITKLEQKRDKTRALKQGMMQELLTGKTRLV